jgi:hypothetical protein
MAFRISFHATSTLVLVPPFSSHCLAFALPGQFSPSFWHRAQVRFCPMW